MSIDTSKILDNFNPNQKSDKGGGGGNQLFKKNSDRDSFGGKNRGRRTIGRYWGSIQWGGGERFSNDRGGRQYIRNNDRFRNDSGGFNPGSEQNSYNPRRNFYDNNANYGGRDFHNREGGHGFGGRERDFRGRGDGFEGGGRGSRFPRDYDDSGRDYEEMKHNFERNDDEYNEEYQMKKEAQFEKEKYLMEFKKNIKIL